MQSHLLIPPSLCSLPSHATRRFAARIQYHLATLLISHLTRHLRNRNIQIPTHPLHKPPARQLLISRLINIQLIRAPTRTPLPGINLRTRVILTEIPGRAGGTGIDDLHRDAADYGRGDGGCLAHGRDLAEVVDAVAGRVYGWALGERAAGADVAADGLGGVVGIAGEGGGVLVWYLSGRL